MKKKFKLFDTISDFKFSCFTIQYHEIFSANLLSPLYAFKCILKYKGWHQYGINTCYSCSEKFPKDQQDPLLKSTMLV